MKKNRSKWKIAGYSLLGVIIILSVAIGIEYYRLQPKNHFKTVPVVSQQTPAQPTEPTEQQPDESKAPSFNVLVLGSDARPGETIGHTDTILLAHVDLENSKVSAFSIPRDTRVHLDGYGYTKLTSVQYVLQAEKGPKEGAEGAVQAISELTGVPINYYVETNFEGFQSLVDVIGGIQMNLPTNVKIDSKVLTAGPHFLDGKTVLRVVRERHSLANGDYGRQQLQLEALKGIAKEALKPTNLAKFPTFVDSISNYITATNMTTSDMVSLGLAMKNLDPNNQISYQQIHGVGQTLYDDVLKANNSEIVVDTQQMKDILATAF